MRRFVTLLSAMCALTMLVEVMASPATAQPYRHRARYAYADTNPYDYPACRVGWWQTLAHGHVRPHWAVWCR